MTSSSDAGPPENDTVALHAVARMRRRIRLLRALRGAIEMALYGAAFAVVVLLGAKTGRLTDGAARRLLWAALFFPALGAAVGALRRVTALMAAQLLDRAYGLKDRLANALEFAAVPAAERSPMMAAAIDDAADHAKRQELRASKALAWRWPAEAAYVGVMGVILVGVAAVEFRTRLPDPPRAHLGALGVRDPLVLADDDVEAFREFARQMDRPGNTQETREALDRFNRFVDQIAGQQLDRQEAFRRLQELQAALEAGSENDREALRQALREVGNRMDQSDLARQLAQALQQADPRAAAEAMRQMAAQLRNNQTTPQQRQDLQRALQRASQRNQDDLAQQVQRARDEVERLLRQQRERQLNDNERRNLRQRQRDLERLTREQQHREQQQRQLARLDRAMSQAAQDLMRDLAQAAQDLEQGAEDLNRMSNEQLSEDQVAELRQQLEDLRQRMRQQQGGQGGQQQRGRIQRFASRARGGLQPGGMESGGGHGGRLTLARGAGGGQGMQVPGPGGQGGQPGGPGNGTEPGGQQAGTGHDERIRGASTSINANMRTVSVTGQQRGNGPSRSQVIRTSAQEGFTSQRYREIHAEYWNHAREVVHAGEVPPGYTSYVRRYFQLIRPRDE